jgi:hypothetical protein
MRRTPSRVRLCGQDDGCEATGEFAAQFGTSPREPVRRRDTEDTVRARQPDARQRRFDHAERTTPGLAFGWALPIEVDAQRVLERNE